MKLSREIKTAILVIASILLFIWGYSFLKGKDLFVNYKTYFVKYDNVDGVINAAPVTINGFVVGKISKIILDKKTGKILVELQLKTDFPIAKSSTASIYESGLVTGKQIAIYPNLHDKILATDGDTLVGSIKEGLIGSFSGKLVPVQEKLERVMVNADKLISGLNNVLDTKGQADLKNSLAELSKTLEQFHKVSISANALIDENRSQIKGVVSNFNKVSSDFSKISDSLNKANLGKVVDNLQKTLTNVNGVIANLQSGKGTMGKLLKDDGMYNNLTKTSKELELLLQDVRLHPTRYVNVSLFGKKEKPYITPKDSLKINY